MRKLRHAEIRRPTLEELGDLRRFPISVVLDDIRSAHNVGSVLRTADAVRAEHVYLCGLTPPGEHRGVHKSALGAQDSVPWTSVTDVVSLARTLKSSGSRLIALEHTDRPGDLQTLSPADYPVCLLVGNEVEGLKDELVALSDFALEIPQFGVKQSLNVSVAAGIALYTLLSRYLSDASTGTITVNSPI